MVVHCIHPWRSLKLFFRRMRWDDDGVVDSSWPSSIAAPCSHVRVVTTEVLPCWETVAGAAPSWIFSVLWSPAGALASSPASSCRVANMPQLVLRYPGTCLPRDASDPVSLFISIGYICISF
jgi:hypothetical protein